MTELPAQPGQLGQLPATGPTGAAATDTRQPVPRRDFLFASGTVGAALVTGGLLGPAAAASQHGRPGNHAAAARSARSVWLSSPDTTPSGADWTALRARCLRTSYLPRPVRLRPGQRAVLSAVRLAAAAGVAYCKTDADVAACLSFVTKFELAVRMRSGGHSYGGWSSVTNGLVIDVSEMNSMKFGSGTVTVGAGIDLINFYSGLAAKGRAVPGGSCPTVGIAGLTLGGGVGVLSRNYGLTC